jgi:2',3'-cyclic-nucleotide 2'-phosphodiesterase (5'-nucleotidase family)
MKHIQRFWLMFVVYSTISQAAPAPGKPSSLRIIHVNDVHSVLLPIKNDGGVCKKGDQCFGGWARSK